MISKTSKLPTRTARAAVAVIALSLLAACTVGPDFRKPAPPDSRRYVPQAEAQPGTGTSATGAPRTLIAKQAGGDWWRTFRSAKLDHVMRAAIGGNHGLAALDATIAQANEAVAATSGGLFPQVDLAATAGRQGAGGAVANAYAVGPTVVFDFDIFGGRKRLVEEQAAFAEAQRHRYDAAYLTLTGNVARQALLLASAHAQIDAVRALLEQDRLNLDLIETGQRFGGATQIDVALATTQTAQDQTLLPPLAQQRDTARHALSVLAGKGPADWVPPDFKLSDFVLPADRPVSLPSEMARQRPDILAAEARLHAASAAIGVATADLYPHLQVSASIASAGPGIGTLWGFASGLTAPLFHGGTLEANRRASVDAYKASVSEYRQTVVGALQQVADVLRAIRHDAEEVAAQKRALSAAQANLRLNQSGFRAGETNVLQVVDAQRTYQRALLGQIRATTSQYLDVVQLAIALGGNADGAFSRDAALGKEGRP